MTFKMINIEKLDPDKDYDPKFLVTYYDGDKTRRMAYHSLWSADFEKFFFPIEEKIEAAPGIDDEIPF